MRTKLIRIGNSRGVRIPAALIAEAGLQDDVELTPTNGGIIIAPSPRPREGWAEDAARLAREGDEFVWEGMKDLPAEIEDWTWPEGR